MAEIELWYGKNLMDEEQNSETDNPQPSQNKYSDAAQRLNGDEPNLLVWLKI